MDYSKLKRSPENVKSALRQTKDGRVITTKPMRLIIPGRFLEKQLAVISSEIYTLGIFALVMDNFYSVSLTPAKMRIDPDSTKYVTWNDEEYIEFEFNAGSIVFPNVNLVKKETLLYEINEELISKGRIPWYLTYEDIGSLYQHSKKFAGTSLGYNHAILEMIAATIARNPDNPVMFYRHLVNTKEDLTKFTPKYIPLKNIGLGASNTTARLMGNYFNDGLTSALVNPSERNEDIETLLRS